MRRIFGHDWMNRHLRSLVLSGLTAATLGSFFAVFSSMTVPPQAVVPVAANAEVTCLAQAVYFEARGEPFEGQLAVAQVVMNRVADRRYPDTVCGVVFQNEHRRHRCQFSFACDGKSDRARDARAWRDARKLAAMVFAFDLKDVTGNATHYHADYVDPKWSRVLPLTTVIGRHLFYYSAPGAVKERRS